MIVHKAQASSSVDLCMLKDLPAELTECDKQELHLIGTIQAECGSILIFDAKRTVQAVSENVCEEEWFNEALYPRPEAALGADARTLFKDQTLADKVLVTLCEDLKRNALERNFLTVGNVTVTVTTSGTDGYMLEIEPDGNSKDELSVHLSEIGRVISSSRPVANSEAGDDGVAEDSMKTALAYSAQALGSIMRVMDRAFERGMVYRFADDNSGEVVHELKHESVKTSYLGMLFPASDIPLSARELYIRNGLRYIKDVNAPSFGIVSRIPVDLGDCRMRGTAKPHVAYLRNMGIRASLSIAIVVEGSLWGLLAFHKYSGPCKPCLRERIAFEAVSKMLSVRIESAMKREKSNRLVKLAGILVKLQNQRAMEFVHKNHQDIMEICKADAIAVRHGSENYFFGDGDLRPTPIFWQKIYEHPLGRETLVVSTKTQMEALGVSDYCSASGMLYFRQGQNNFAALRKVRTRDVCWAGSPDEPKLRIGDILHPRKSFEAYMERAKKESQQWSAQDVDIFEAFRERIVDRIKAEVMQRLNHSLKTSNENCAEAIKLAEKNYEFFAHMSHELRTPFHGVLACLNLMEGNKDEKERDEMLRIASTCGKNMLEILDNILSMAKKRAGIENECKEFLLGSSVSGVAELMQAYAVSTGRKFITYMDPDVAGSWCTGDQTKYEQVITNLANNAIKFSSETDGLVELHCQICPNREGLTDLWKSISSQYKSQAVIVNSESNAFTDSRPWVCTWLKNNGRGIPEDKMQTIFEPYTQISSGVSKTHQGTGLGLHICSEHTRKMKGVFQLCSYQGGDSIFFCAIPQEAPSPPVATPKNGATGEASTPPQTVWERLKSADREFCAIDALDNNSSPEKTAHARRGEGSSEPFQDFTLPPPPNRSAPSPNYVSAGAILVVDDNHVNLKLACRQVGLIARNISVYSACHGLDGYTRYKDMVQMGHGPMLLLVDYHMPVLSGVECVRYIREYERENNLSPSSICCYTADISEKSELEIMDAGCNLIVPKPTPPDLLRTIITERLLSLPEASKPLDS